MEWIEGSCRGRRLSVSGLAGRLAPIFWLFLLTSGLTPASELSDRSARPDQLAELSRSPEERQAWGMVLTAPAAQRYQRASDFLSRYPSSLLVPEVHYLMATDSYQQQRFEEFVRHAELALANFSRAVEADSRQRLRQQQVRSQLAFYYAETGSLEPAAEQASRLLEDLTEGVAQLTPEQWREHRAEFAAAGHYVLGRVALGEAARESDPERRRQRLADAAVELDRALHFAPADSYAWHRRATVHQLQGRLGDALEGFARAAALPGPVAPVARKRAEILFQQLEPPGSLDQFLFEQRAQLKKILAGNPRSIRALPDGVAHPIYWWDGVPTEALERRQRAPFSNLRRIDYAGPEACQPCHDDKYQAWRKHSHSRMNAVAEADSVQGDFSGESIDYLGGKATFFRDQDRYLMKLERDQVKRTYRVRRTIGSRFFQYYVGVLIEGPDLSTDAVWKEDHVLPFGYWLEPGEWVPVVHIDPEVPDDQRTDPFATASQALYDRTCSACHTTRPIGDWMLMTDGRLRLADFSPRQLSFWIYPYLESAHPELLAGGDPLDWRTAQLNEMLQQQFDQLPAREHAVVLGVSCEACHNGARQHVLKSEKQKTEQPPLFFPAGPEVFIDRQESPQQIWGREARNLNWICARCHSGGRPQYAAGIDTWNSTEYSDASAGACYSGVNEHGKGPLTCVTCHDPHFTIGQQWSRKPGLDDAKCLGCHPQFDDSVRRRKHTRHDPGTPGDRCMNCHMPRINEGLQDAVRTHHIFSPTEPRMIESNQPNACNLCHLDRPIDWTLTSLKEWYGRSYAEEAIVSAYPRRQEAAAVGWLASSHESTRLVASSALTRGDARWALSELIELLDDPYLLNRQFTQRGLEKMLGVRLNDYGYRFYQTAEERQQPLQRLREELLRSNGRNER